MAYTKGKKRTYKKRAYKKKAHKRFKRKRFIKGNTIVKGMSYDKAVFVKLPYV